VSILWVADPWESLDHPFDTTVRLLRESVARGNVNYWCDYRDISWDITNASLKGCRVLGSDYSRQSAESITFGPVEHKKNLNFDCIMLRADPPVTASYSDAIQLLVASLERIGKSPELVLVNPPGVVLGHDGKLMALHSQDDAPRTIVSSSIRQLCDFTDSEGIAVLKPLHRHGGRGVRLVRKELGRAKLVQLVNNMTSKESVCILAQQYLENHRQTEKRLWFVDGDVLGVCKKRFQNGRFPPILAKNRYVAAATLSIQEQKLCARLGATLRKLNVRIAGVDLIDGRVTDVNVVSPGLLVEMEQVTTENLALKTLEAIEGANAIQRSRV
jgi:glutathione synthase